MLLKVNQLSVLTNNTRPVALLKNIDLTLLPNSAVTITGKNGSGKTTLIKAVTGLLNRNMYSTTGEIYLDEEPLSQVSEQKLLSLRKDKIKYVFQDAINSFDPLKKIEYYFDRIAADLSAADELLEYFYLPARKKLFSLHQYQLSGGMAQRTALVLAFSANPELLILDEPTSNLDSPVINLLIHKLKDFIKKKNNSLLLVTQDLSFALEISTYIGIIENKMLSDLMDPQTFRSEYSEKLNLFEGRETA